MPLSRWFLVVVLDSTDTRVSHSVNTVLVCFVELSTHGICRYRSHHYVVRLSLFFVRPFTACCLPLCDFSIFLHPSTPINGYSDQLGDNHGLCTGITILRPLETWQFILRQLKARRLRPNDVHSRESRNTATNEAEQEKQASYHLHPCPFYTVLRLLCWRLQKRLTISTVMTTCS